MDQDEKTERGHRGPAAVRSTAPAGTPYPVVPNPPPAVPAPSASQPRTLGGHTARLLLAEDEAIDFDPLGSGSSEPPLSEGPKLPPLSEGPPSTTVGGTQRLDAVSAEEAAQARKDLARQEAQAKKRAAPADQPVTTGEPPKPETPKPPARATPGATPADAEKSPPKPAPVQPPDDGEPSTFALLRAPVSVAVGLVFFAMGCMIGLIIEGRVIRFPVAAPVIEPAHPTAPSVAAGPTQAAGTSTGATPPPHVAATASPPPASSAKPTVPPPTARPRGAGTPGTGKGLQPIF